MVLTDIFNIIDFLKGPDLLVNNIFRLAQLPVDVQDKELKKRHKAVEMAKKMNMPIPPGILPVFPEDQEDEEVLKEVLHTLQDPLNRLFNEMFWFWPETFGKSLEDEGLSLLVADKLKPTLKLWQKKEKENNSFIPIHNQAVVHQYLALRSEIQMLDAKEPAKKRGILGFKRSHPDAGKAKKHWEEAFKKWRILMDNDLFWAYLKDRIIAYDDPRLPVTMADLLKDHMPKIILSINVHLVFKAAKADLSDQAARHLKIINASGFDPETIEQTIDAFTENYRSQITHFCKGAKEEAKKDPIKADLPARELAKQATAVLDMLSQIYQTHHDTINALYDQVAVAIAQCTDTYDSKTQDWDTSLELLTIAEPFARGQAAIKRIEKDIKQVKDLKRDENDWVQKGYFDLPAPCVELLENARVYMRADQYSESINLLGKAYTSETAMPEYSTLKPYLQHCLAFNFKCLSISTHNKAFDTYNNKVAWALKESIANNRLLGLHALDIRAIALESNTSCNSCRSPIYGEYIIRTIEGGEYNFCMSCNRKLTSKFDGFEKTLKQSLKQSLDQMILAEYFEPEFKPIVKNIKTIRQTASEKGVNGKNPMDLRIEHNLLSLDEIINYLTRTQSFKNTSKLKTIWKQFVRRVSSWAIDQRDESLAQVFSAMAKNKHNCDTLLNLFYKDNYIFSRFVKFCLSDPAIASGGTESTIVKVLTSQADTWLQFQFLNLCKTISNQKHPITEHFLSSIEEYVIQFINNNKNIDSSILSGQLKQILKEAQNYDANLEFKLLLSIIKTCSENNSKATSLVKIADANINKKFYQSFYRILGSDQLTIEEKIPYFVILVRHDNQTRRFKALKWVCAHVENPRKKFTILIRGLDDPNEKINDFALIKLFELKDESFRFLLEASQTKKENQYNSICKLLEKIKPDIQWQTVKAPYEDSLINICVESRAKLISFLALETLEKCHPNWMKNPKLNAWISWFKHSVDSDNQVAAHVCEKLILKIRQQSLWKKFKVWHAEKIRKPEGKHKKWWIFKSLSQLSQTTKQTAPVISDNSKTPAAAPRQTFNLAPCEDCGNFKYHFYDDTGEYLCSMCGWVSPEKSSTHPDAEKKLSPPSDNTTSPPVQDRSPLTSGVMKIISDQLGVSMDELNDELDMETNLFDYGLDSLDMVEITMNIEEEFNLTISDEDVAGVKTMSDICDYLVQHA